MASMTVISATAIPDHVRGALTRWLIEATPNLYVGTVSARVREELWETVREVIEDGAAVLIHPDNNEQGFSIKTAGSRRRQPVDFDGLTLISFVPEVTEQAMFDNETVDW